MAWSTESFVVSNFRNTESYALSLTRSDPGVGSRVGILIIGVVLLLELCSCSALN